MKTNELWPRIIGTATIALGLTLGAVPPAVGDHGDAHGARKVVPRNESTHGNTYGDWTVRWLQWLLSVPAASSPPLDDTGASCGLGQAGPVWFLAGTFGGDPVTRACTVPAGKHLFFPLTNGIFGAAVFDCAPTVPEVVCNLNDLRVAATASMNSVDLAASIDGKELKRLGGQRVPSPAFDLTLPTDNFFGLDAGTYGPHVADGYWLMIEPLSAGMHTLQFRAEITGGVFAGTIVEVTYDLTIEP